MTQPLPDVAHTPERGIAQFFYEVGFASCFAEVTIRNDLVPPFALTDALIEQAWPRSIEAHDDGEEMDRYLAMANSHDALVKALEGLLAHVEAMQSQCRQYVEPTGYTAFDRKRIVFERDQEAKDSLFTNDMIYLLDGPEQREAQEAARTALQTARGRE